MEISYYNHKKQLSVSDLLVISDESEIKDKLFCSICSNIMMDPVQFCTQGHTFCRSCLECWFLKKENNLSCPLCREIYENVIVNHIQNQLHLNQQTHFNNNNNNYSNSNYNCIKNLPDYWECGTCKTLNEIIQITCTNCFINLPKQQQKQYQEYQLNRLNNNNNNSNNNNNRSISNNKSFKFSSNNEIKKKINKTLVRCPYYFNDIINFEEKDENGCNESIMFGELKNHIKECQFRFIECSNSVDALGLLNENNCYCNIQEKKLLRLNQIEEHNNVCPFFELKCNYCDNYFYRKNEEKHSNKCPKFLIECAECFEMIPRSIYQKHVVECQTIECPYKAYGCLDKFMKSDKTKHLDLYDKHHQFLLKKLNHLQLQIDQLRSDYDFLALKKVIQLDNLFLSSIPFERESIRFELDRKLFENQYYLKLTFNHVEMYSKLDLVLFYNGDQILNEKNQFFIEDCKHLIFFFSPDKIKDGSKPFKLIMFLESNENRSIEEKKELYNNLFLN